MIKKTFNKNGYTYKLIKKSERDNDRQVAIYEQIHKNGEVMAYEVHLIRFRVLTKDKPLFELKAGDEEIANPSNEDWGSFGWTFLKLAEAEKKLIELKRRIAQNGVSKH